MVDMNVSPLVRYEQMAQPQFENQSPRSIIASPPFNHLLATALLLDKAHVQTPSVSATIPRTNLPLARAGYPYNLYLCLLLSSSLFGLRLHFIARHSQKRFC